MADSIRWEYTTFTIDPAPMDWKSQIDALGEAGWEAVGQFAIGMSGNYYPMLLFKRPCGPPPPDEQSETSTSSLLIR